MHDSEPLILVNETDQAIGSGTKLAVHTHGLLHRAFSIFLVDSAGRVLLQRRQNTKYHSAGLWANSCCGHPRPGETTLAAATRRLREEMAVDADLEFRFQARYRAQLDTGMHENELVHVYFGRLCGQPTPNPEEASDTDLLSLTQLHDLCETTPAACAVWLRHYLKNHSREIALAVNDMWRTAPAAAPADRTTDHHSAQREIRP